LGKYRLEGRIGRGSFAEVWKARDTVENRQVALKIANPDLVDEHGRAELEKEARIAAHLHHPNIVGVRNADWIEGRFVLVSDLAMRSLAASPGIRRSGAAALRVIRDVAAGLAYAHERRLIHRDLKPENILIFPDRRAALADFGVSSFAHGATAYTDAGTLGYLAPEQAYGRPALGSDVFSLGLIAYELLTGVLMSWPFDWPPEGIRRFEAKVPAPVRKVLRRAAEFEPSRRYPDAIVFQRALEKAFARAEGGSSARTPRRRKRPAPAQSPLAVQAEVFRRRHGARLGMRFRCHRCEGPIAESFKSCPWCGSAENSFREVTRAPLVCPSCERGVLAEWTKCPWCYEGRFEGNGRKPRHDSSAERTCTRAGCDGQLRPFMRYCPLCKQKPRRVWTDVELPDRCPRCRWPTSREFWHFCPWCGRRERGAGRFTRTRSTPTSRKTRR
jgi:serine/threonine-protein kinase